MSSEAGRAAPLAPAAPREPVIRARRLTKAYHVYARPQDRLKQMLWPGRRRFYREFLAVDGVDLDIFRGETVGVVGRNGSGKSTLLRLICGTVARTTGELDVVGHVAPLLSLGAGFNPEFTGRENVFMNAAILGLSDAETRERIGAIAAFADIGEFFEQPVKSYSTGMYARLAFAVAIHVDPEILVVDEVLAVGDEAFTRRCFARIEQIKASGATILFVSHAASWVIELCDRALLLEGGRRLLTAEPKTVIGRYQKLIHAEPEQVDGILAEIRELDGGPRAGAPGRPRPALRPASPGRVDGPAAAADPGFAGFDAALASASTVVYEPNGAVIRRPRIVDGAGRVVNVLRKGEAYAYEYEVEFLEAARGARFGMMVKLQTGFDLGGQVSHAPGDGLGRVEPGTRVRVRFTLRPLLVPGVYFLNAGVVAARGRGERYLHRILDAVAFRVEGDLRQPITGRVDLSAGSGCELVVEPPGGARVSKEC